MNMQEPVIERSCWYSAAWTNFFRSTVLIFPSNHHTTLSEHAGITLSVQIGKMLTLGSDKLSVASRLDVVMSWLSPWSPCAPIGLSDCSVIDSAISSFKAAYEGLCDKIGDLDRVLVALRFSTKHKTSTYLDGSPRFVVVSSFFPLFNKL